MDRRQFFLCTTVGIGAVAFSASSLLYLNRHKIYTDLLNVSLDSNAGTRKGVGKVTYGLVEALLPSDASGNFTAQTIK